MKTDPDPVETLRELIELAYSPLASLVAGLADNLGLSYQKTEIETEQSRRYARTRADVEAKRKAARISRPAIRSDSRGHQVRYINRRNGTDRRQ